MAGLGKIEQQITTIPGRRYVISFDIIETNENSNSRYNLDVGSSQGANDLLDKELGGSESCSLDAKQTYEFVATGTATWVSFWTQDPPYDAWWIIDNVTCKETIITNGTFMDDISNWIDSGDPGSQLLWFDEGSGGCLSGWMVLVADGGA